MTAAPDPRSLDRAPRPERVAYAMRALGKAGLPGSIELAGVTYRLVRSVKHDFFAATGFYDDAAGRRVVLKFGRTREFAGLPLLWLGRWLCRRELRFYRKLKHVRAVPKVLGTVGPTGFVLEYVDALPLSKDRPVPDGFFRELQYLIDDVHRLDLAYVDANKVQNILVGTDGRPHLIDFQISWDLEDLGDWWLPRWIQARFQAEDRYHVLKHKKRFRPDELTPDERLRAERKSLAVRVHRFVFRPYFRLRRRTFQRMRATGRLLPEGSK